MDDITGMLGDYWNAEVVRDLKTVYKTVYTTYDEGKAKASFIGYNVYGIKENHLHTWLSCMIKKGHESPVEFSFLINSYSWLS